MGNTVGCKDVCVVGGKCKGALLLEGDDTVETVGLPKPVLSNNPVMSDPKQGSEEAAEVVENSRADITGTYEEVVENDRADITGTYDVLSPSGELWGTHVYDTRTLGRCRGRQHSALPQ